MWAATIVFMPFALYRRHFRCKSDAPVFYNIVNVAEVKSGLMDNKSIFYPLRGPTSALCRYIVFIYYYFFFLRISPPKRADAHVFYGIIIIEVLHYLKFKYYYYSQPTSTPPMPSRVNRIQRYIFILAVTIVSAVRVTNWGNSITTSGN